MFEDFTTDAEGGLASKTKENEPHVMDNRSDHEVPTPKLNDNYLNASVVFLRGNTYARGRLIRRKIYVDGNVVGTMKYNPILDTHEYCVEFAYGEVRKLTANVIVESMYATCDDDVNYYFNDGLNSGIPEEW